MAVPDDAIYYRPWTGRRQLATETTCQPHLRGYAYPLTAKALRLRRHHGLEPIITSPLPLSILTRSDPIRQPHEKSILVCAECQVITYSYGPALDLVTDASDVYHHEPAASKSMPHVRLRVHTCY
jgi:hypothetical protein